MKKRVIVTTVPFGDADRAPLDLLRQAGVELVMNPHGRRLQPHEVGDVIEGFPVVIAGTERIDASVMAKARDLKAICRVGIGLDSIDLIAARRLGIAVSYTPDGPSPAVAELTIGLIIDLLREVAAADRTMRQGTWRRSVGTRLATSVVGVLGVGRIGRRVIGHLQGGFPGVKILANDLTVDASLAGVEWVDKESLYRRSDVVTVHLPLTRRTLGLITRRELASMKPTALLVNTARGGIVNETDLVEALRGKIIRAAALDVFSEEPYRGELAQLPNVLLTCHMGSMTADCRAQMEIEATQEAIRFLSGMPMRSAVPDEEYENCAMQAAQ